MEPGDDGALRLLREAAPVRDADLGADPRVREALAELHAGLLETRAPRRRPRFLGDGLAWATPGGNNAGRFVSRFGRVGVVLAAAAATALVLVGVVGLQTFRGGGGPALSTASPSPSATGVPLHTGVFGAKRPPTDWGPGEWADESEWLNLGSPAMPGYLRKTTAGLRLAPGSDWGTAERALTRPGRRLQVSAVIVSLRSYQLCTWARAWDPRSRSETAPKTVEDAARFRFSVTAEDGRTRHVVMSLIKGDLTASRVESYVREQCGAHWTVHGKLW